MKTKSEIEEIVEDWFNNHSETTHDLIIKDNNPNKLKQYEKGINRKNIWTYKCDARMKTIYKNNKWSYELHIGLDKTY